MKIALAALVAACLAVPVSHAVAEVQCAPRDVIAPQIGERYGEVARFRGLADNAILEVWLNAETGTWTLTVTHPDRTMCVPATGTAGAVMESTEPEEPSEGA